MGKRRVCFLFLIVVMAGCATMFRAPLAVKTSCAHDRAWEAAMDSVSGLTLYDTDQEDGIIVTGWSTMESGRAAGVFQRTNNRERARFFLNVEPAGDAVAISVRQDREFFSPTGVQSQSTKWRRIASNAEEERRLIQQLTTQLKDKGCAILN